MALWITDPAAPPVRVTEDVDVIVEVTSRRAYYEFEERLREAGFREEQQVICRWLHRDTDLVLDAMPADASILSFENRWQREALPHAVDVNLLSGAHIRAVPPAYLLATKLEAFAGRGEDDMLASQDFADIVALIDGREELIRMCGRPHVSCAGTSPTNSADLSAAAAFSMASPHNFAATK